VRAEYRALAFLLCCVAASGAALAQMPAYAPPPDEVDSETVLGFIVIAIAAVAYWLWKRSKRNAVRDAATQSKPPGLDTPPPGLDPRVARPADDVTGSVFISYRRGDAGDVVGRIYDRLIDRFGRTHVFKDVDSIPLGVDFRRHLSDSVGQCRVFLAVISRGWVQQSDGVRRLDQPNDFVRIEMEAALQRNIPVIPVLVQGAALPEEKELPPSLRDLAYRNATVVRADPDFHADIVRLMEGIAFHLQSRPPQGDSARPH
jgi:hypothetical protein